jgi:hypothetical protein
MSDDATDLPPGAFLASMPWWVVLGRDDSAASDSPGYLVLDVDGGTCLAVFTDEDLAQRFVTEVDFDGGPLPVQTPGQFIALAAKLPPICTYAAFDPPPRVGGRARWVVPLEEVGRALEQARREHDAAAGEEVDGDE